MQDIGERIQMVLDAKHINARKMAKAIFVTPPAVYSYLTGATKPSLQTINLIALIYNINVEWLLTGEGDMNATLKERDISFISRTLTAEDNEFRLKLVKTIVELPEEQLIVLSDILHKLTAPPSDL